jgi:hypothetical protein
MGKLYEFKSSTITSNKKGINIRKEIRDSKVIDSILEQ